jgi:hypothetical protein
MKIPTKIPTILGLILLICVVGGMAFFVERIFRTETKASGSREPKQIKVTNISDTTFTVSWLTEITTTGTLLVSAKNKSNKIYFDERDHSGKLGEFNTHSVTVRDVIPDSDYSVTPLVNGKPHILADKPILIRTPSSLPLNTGGLEPAYGVIQNEDGTPSNDALLYLTIEGGQELSTISKSSGSWIIPLNQTRTADLTSFLPVIERMNENIQIFTGKSQSNVSTDSLNDSPVPEVQIGKDFDFKRLQAKKTTNSVIALRPITPAAETKQEQATFPSKTAVLGDTIQKKHSVTLLNPKDKSSLSSTVPLIQGTGVPGKFIGISVGLMNPQHGSIQVAADGTWNYTPKIILSPGKQSVTITGIDSNGKTVAITHMFNIFKSGTQVLGDATPSATLAPSETLAPTPISTIDTQVVTETISPENPVEGTPPPVSGNELPTLILLLVGFGLLAGGSVVLMK